MGISFKISKVGTRFRPKPLPIEDSGSENDGAAAQSQQSTAECDYAGVGGDVDRANVIVNSGLQSALEDLEVSFSLNLFTDGFSVGKITEVFDDVPRQLRPYNRASKTFFSAIEYGWLPGDIVNDIPCKYMNGAVLCEVRDYRKCMFPKADSTSAENSPVVHKVKLQMCMENVVNDLFSLSDDSWTYGDLLEAESCILKTLQPNLHLNPHPVLDRNAPTKKLDLGITWSWKKRERNAPPATNRGSNNPYNVTSILGDVQSSTSELVETYQGRGVSCLEQPNSISNPNLISEPSCQIADSYNQPVLNLLTNPSNLVSEPIHVVANNSDPRKFNSLGFGESTRCITQAIEGHIMKKPKTEPLEFNLDPEIQWSNSLLHQRAMAEKFQHERSRARSSLLLSQGNNPQLVSKGMPNLLAGMPFAVKQELAETNLVSSNVGKRNDKETAMYPRSNQSNHQQPHMQCPSPTLSANTLSNVASTQIDPHIGKKPRKNSGTQKRKTLMNPQVAVDATNSSVSYCHSEVVQGNASGPGKRQKKNSGPKGRKVVDLLGCSNSNAANFISPPFCNLPLPQPSTDKCDPDPLERFMKIKGTTQSYGLNKSKHKLDLPCQKKAVFHRTPLIALHLSKSDDNQNSKQTRTCTYIRPGDETSEVDCESHAKLVISEELSERMVETSVLYQSTKETESADAHTITSFPSTISVERFAAQFRSLMVREGYNLESDKIESTLLNTADSSISQRQSVPSSCIPEVKTVGRPLPTLSPRPSPIMQSSTDLSAIHASHFSPNILSGIAPFPPGSTIQLSANPRAESQLDIAAMGKSSQTRNPRSKSQHDIAGKGYSKKSPNPLSKLQLDVADKRNSNPQSKSKLDVAAKGKSMQSQDPLSKSRFDVDAKGNVMLSSHILESQNPLSKPQVDISAKGNPMQPYNPLSTSQHDIAAKENQMQSSWQQILNKRAHLQFQMQQRQQEQIMQRQAMIGRLGLGAYGPAGMQLGNGIQGLGNINFASLTGTGGSMPSLMGGQVPWIGNMGQLNNLGNNLLSSNESNQFSSSNAASRAHPPPSEVPIPTSASNMARNLNHHQQLHRRPQEHNQQNRAREATSMLFQSPPESGFLLEHVVGSSSTPSQGSRQQPEMSSQPLFPGFLFQHGTAGGIRGGPESPELSSRTHRSAGSSSNANSNRVPEILKKDSAGAWFGGM